MSEQPSPTPSISQLLAEVTVENQALRRRAERAEAAFAGAFEKGMLRQLERQLHEEQNPGRSVTLGPALADSATGPLDVERLWKVLEGFGVIANGTWVSFQREDAEKIAAEYASQSSGAPE